MIYRCCFQFGASAMTQPPSLPPLNYATPQSGIDLRKVAKDQRALMCCILGYFIAFVLQFALPPGLRWVLGVVALAVSITGIVFVFKLAIELYSTGAGIVLGILTLIPLIWL